MSSTMTSPMSMTTRQIAAGALGGLAGGVAFGVMMQLMGMMGMIAQLVNSEAVVVGWVVHLTISVFFGVAFAALVSLLGARAVAPGMAVGLGLGYSVVLWVVGALLLMPARLGMPVFELGTTAWRSLVGHLVFGAVLGLVVSAMHKTSGERGA